jgi:glutathione S-transferase
VADLGAVTGAATLYVILGSHAGRAAMLMLDHKGIGYRTVTLPTGFHPLLVRLRGFPASAGPRLAGEGRTLSIAVADRLGTVPALRLGDERTQTNREISRFLDRIQPDPPLFPSDPDARDAVEEAEAWGDEVLQMTARRLTLAAVLHGPDALIGRANSGRLGPLLWRNEKVRYLGCRALARTAWRAGGEAERELLASLPGELDKVDSWIDSGVLNGETLNAADFMIAPSLALLGYRRDLAPDLEMRPAWRLVERVLPATAASP